MTVYESEEEKIENLGKGWYKVVGKAIIQNITPEEAEEIAINNACRDLIQFHSGVEVRQRTFDLQTESHQNIILNNFLALNEQITNGVVLEKKIISSKIVTDEKNAIKVVTLNVRIGTQKGKKDPYFNIKAALNKTVFKESEELELTVQATKNCYLNVINICSDNTVYIIFPNQYRNNNFLKAGDTFIIPNDDDKAMGLSFPTRLNAGKESENEIIKIIATKEKFLLLASDQVSEFGPYEMALKKLLSLLIEIPRSEFEEIDLPFAIYKQ